MTQTKKEMIPLLIELILKQGGTQKQIDDILLANKGEAIFHALWFLQIEIGDKFLEVIKREDLSDAMYGIERAI